MTDKNVSEESDFDLAKSELRDLIHFWDSLSLWEKDESISTVQDFLDRLSESDEVSKKQMQNMQDQVKALKESNHIEKMSKMNMTLEQCLELRKSIRKKPNFNQSMEIIKSLSKKELMELGDYMGLNPAKISLMKDADLHLLYEDVLTTKSIAIFFAIRNYLGKKYM